MRLDASPSVRVVGLVVGVLLLASCGDDGDGVTGSNVNAPEITNLQVLPATPEKANTNVTYLATVNFTDPNGDVAGGQCEILLDGQSIGRSTVTPDPGVPANLTSGIVQCQFSVNSPVPKQISAALHVFDLAGNQSNDLSFVLSITQLPRGTVSGGTGRVTGRMESATEKR